ncbi:MAG: NnrS family protein [Pseudomonadota bacterium]
MAGVVHHAGPLTAHASLPPSIWHAHEMLYGYAFAVIAGFLLTAVRNWTGIATLQHWPLLGLVLVWCVPRLLAPTGLPLALEAMATLDLLFGLVLAAAVATPVIRARQWMQLPVIAIPLLLTLAHALFYLGALRSWGWAVQAGLELGLYLIVLLILVMGGRVVPFFIEKGVDHPVRLRQRSWMVVVIPAALFAFALVQLVAPSGPLPGLLAAGLTALLLLRLYDWHTRWLWRKPLLWSLYLGFAWIALGFALETFGPLTPLHPSLATHALAYGGIGLVTLGMMSRVALGHTGRDVFHPPRWVGVSLALVAIGAVARVLLPLAWPGLYTTWVGLAQVLWVLAFLLFLVLYARPLILPRVDRRPG